MNIVINPGSGPVAKGTVEQSEINIQKFIEDVAIENMTYRFRKSDESGRHDYEVYGNNEVVEVSMPAIPLDKVRYVGTEDQNIWHFPRLYVDGSSWVWMYAVDITRSHILKEEEED